MFARHTQSVIDETLVIQMLQHIWQMSLVKIGESLIEDNGYRVFFPDFKPPLLYGNYLKYTNKII